MVWVRRTLAVIHVAAGLTFVAGGVSYLVIGVLGLPQLLARAPRTPAPTSLLLLVGGVLLPELALGGAFLLLARWLWSGHARLRTALLSVHTVVLLLGLLFIKWGLDAVAAAERSAARGGGLLGAAAFFPFFVGVPLLAFALVCIAAALWTVPRHD